MLISGFDQEIYDNGRREEGRIEGRKEGRIEGRKEGQNLLVQAIRLLREGKTEAEILQEGIDEHTLELAKACK